MATPISRDCLLQNAIYRFMFVFFIRRLLLLRTKAPLVLGIILRLVRAFLLFVDVCEIAVAVLHAVNISCMLFELNNSSWRCCLCTRNIRKHWEGKTFTSAFIVFSNSSL